MPSKRENLYAALDRNFHEPSRLAIVSALCAASDGLSFNELKDTCALTDGNLSRHLKTLEEAGAVAIRKSFSNSRPLTTVHLSDLGREAFVDYLAALEGVLAKAADALNAEEKSVLFRPVLQGQPV
jgi:DNA-binding MarR family transcriptional regulator